jgi:hypothetical protein
MEMVQQMKILNAVLAVRESLQNFVIAVNQITLPSTILLSTDKLLVVRSQPFLAA